MATFTILMKIFYKLFPQLFLQYKGIQAWFGEFFI